ncbi:MAG: nuclear transport factor 2 family protein [Cyanobacteria bacterium J06641_5]
MKTRWMNVFVTVAIVASVLATPPPAIASPNLLTATKLPLTTASAAADKTTIRQLTQQWFAAWSPGATSIDWDAMGELFVREPGRLLVFDDAGDRVVVLESWEDYRSTWEPFMVQFATWQVAPEGEIRVLVDGNLATTTFTLAGGGTDREGNVVRFRQRGTHVWQRSNGRWEIVREHLTTDE